MKILPLIAAVAVPLWLAGCATPPAPAPASLAATAAPQWYAPLPHLGTLSDLTLWWQQFNDPLLVQLIESAQTSSPDVASARSRIVQAGAIRTAANAALLPVVDAQASLARNSAQPPTPVATTLQAGLQAGWEIDLFGGNAQALRAAQARLESAQAGWHDARVSVAAETANTYVNLRTCEQLRTVAENDARSRSETARLADLTAQAGFTAPATAALARASAAEASVRTIQQAALCDIEVKVLVQLSAIPEPQLRQQLALPWQQAQPPLLPVVSLPAQLLAQRPDIYQAEREVAAASADTGSAQAQLYPRLSLNGSIAAGLVRVGGANVDAQTWAIGPLAVSLPLFDGGRRAANVEAARARYDAAVAAYTARVRLAVREVEQALVTLESSRLRLADARVAYEGYRTFYIATEARYRAGLGTLVELEDARRSALVTETQLVSLQREMASAWIALYRAVGGGWARPDAPSA